MHQDKLLVEGTIRGGDTLSATRVLVDGILCDVDVIRLAYVSTDD